MKQSEFIRITDIQFCGDVEFGVTQTGCVGSYPTQSGHPIPTCRYHLQHVVGVGAIYHVVKGPHC